MQIIFSAHSPKNWMRTHIGIEIEIATETENVGEMGRGLARLVGWLVGWLFVWIFLYFCLCNLILHVLVHLHFGANTLNHAIMDHACMLCMHSCIPTLLAWRMKINCMCLQFFFGMYLITDGVLMKLFHISVHLLASRGPLMPITRKQSQTMQNIGHATVLCAV